ncbi:hypothetical protein OG439_46355 [Amycolatopsis sp. NBC_01307]|uniref:hypothetical protein n=1 Tax=Amycolatopsis sp. NBC_01307 TaxID=2903561 RepID=UPI002E13681F|nr:hypothetical protein OG439_46355 [Amycolatopsis sp. NBC_01307]
MTKTTKDITRLIDDLRALLPRRPLSYGESLHAARLQAAELRKQLEASEPDFNLIWLIEQQTVPVSFAPEYK